MNTRGLTELIVLNLALDVGAISNTLFAMLVIMAVVTTLMAGPLLKLLDPKNEYGRAVEDEFADAALAAVQAHPGAPGAGALDPGRSGDRRRHRAAGRAGRAAGPLGAAARADRRPPRPAASRCRRRAFAAACSRRTSLLERASRQINELRERLASRRASWCRGVALTSTNPGSDLAHIVEREPVDLVLTEGTPPPDRRGGAARRRDRAARARARRDVAVLVAKEGDPIELGPDKPVLVPFGGAEHDWAALELGSWLAASTGAPLKLLGAAGQTDEGKSVTRMLADAGLLVQQATGIATEPLVVAGGRDSIIAAADGARACSCSASRTAGAVRGSVRRARRSPGRRRRRCCSSGAGPDPGCSHRRRTSRSSGGRWPQGRRACWARLAGRPARRSRRPRGRPRRATDLRFLRAPSEGASWRRPEAIRLGPAPFGHLLTSVG